ncbi:terpene synthase 21 [Hibiscus trionum]|uniref:(+)-delta-cadinene synthase n=1 Tax=Hibiscus trionum TaxID=183268 RepID=A0A9W7IHN6_HIBTR|nr:terpene synthase 21 [Hibiscus trionum]
MALQATATAATAATAASTYLFVRRVSCPMIPIKMRGNACFASTNSSSISAAASQQPPLPITRHQDQPVRPLQNFSPDTWGDRFITLPFTNLEFESCSRQVELMKKMVKEMLMSSRDDPIENILFINSLLRLGVSYHFEIEIEEQLSHLFRTFQIDSKDYDLHTVAVIFQVFRSHGYKMSCDVFNKFKNDDGMFKEELASDTKGIISLYEACQWGMHQEHILDEALTFTTLHLESLSISRSCPDHLREYIGNALKFPFHKGMPRLESKQYICYYEHDEWRNDLLLKFAKYDFNRVQMLHQKELSLLSSWWQKENIASRFPHGRQRLVESFFMAVSMLFEPQFALARNIMSKWYIGLTLIDDTYDAYGLYEELRSLNKAIQRWDRSAVNELPGEYLRNIYECFLDISDEVDEAVRKEGRSWSVFHAKEAMKEQVQGYHVEARWLHENIMPTYGEYFENGLLSIGAIPTLAILMMGMREADEDAYRWLLNCDATATIVRAMCVMCRVYNDMRSNEDEEERGGQLSGITCYRKEYGVSKKEAVEGFCERIKVAWKDMNEGFMEMKPMPVAKRILVTAFNIARVPEVCYKDDNGFTKPEITYKDYITKVLIDPISHEE